MHDWHQHGDPEVERFLKAARRSALATPPPAPDDELRRLFSGRASEPAPATTPGRETRPARLRRLLSTLAAKGAAALLGGGLVIGGLGVAGALPGGGAPASHQAAPAPSDDLSGSAATINGAPNGEPDNGLPAGGAGADADAITAARTTGRRSTNAAVPDDMSPAAAPTSASEAARTHSFDEACGNHGTYESWFAQHGVEPACATDARTTGDTSAVPSSAGVTATASPLPSSSVRSTPGKSASLHHDQQRKG